MINSILKHPIMGPNQVTSEQMVQFVTQVHPTFHPTIADQFLAIGKKYGVRGDVAFCQAILESNWFRFGGDVRASQNNFAGLGATGGTTGASFVSIEQGVTAQIQHLYAYATKAALPPGETIVDPRFHLVVRGSVPNWEDLAGKWAFPGYDKTKYRNLEEALAANDTYDQKIIALFNRLKGVNQEDPNAWKLEGVNWLYEQGFLTNERWKDQINEPLPLWAEALILKRMYQKITNEQ